MRKAGGRLMAAEQLIDPRTFPAVSAPIAAPRQQVTPPPVTPRAEPDRVQQRLSDAERRLDLLEGGLATLAGALNGDRKR